MDGNFHDDADLSADRPLKAFGKKKLLEILEDKIYKEIPEFPQNLTALFQNAVPQQAVKNPQLISACVDEIYRQSKEDFERASSVDEQHEALHFMIRLCSLFRNAHENIESGALPQEKKLYQEIHNKSGQAAYAWVIQMAKETAIRHPAPPKEVLAAGPNTAPRMTPWRIVFFR